MDNLSYEKYTLGAATFDMSGLPKEYFTLADGDKNISWIQTIFQILGLRSLLATSLKLDNFYYTVLQGSECTAIVVKQSSSYLALLVIPDPEMISDHNFINWVRQLNVNELKQNPRFQAV